MLGVALLVGVAAGASLTAAAGARRTDSAYPWFLAKYGVFHTEVIAERFGLSPGDTVTITSRRWRSERVQTT